MRNRLLWTILSLFLVIIISPIVFAVDFETEVKITYQWIAPDNQSSVIEIDATYGHALTSVGEIPEGYAFAFWIENGMVRKDLDYSATFYATDDLDLVLVLYQEGLYAVVYMDSNGKLIDSEFVDDETPITTPSYAGLDKPGHAVNESNPWRDSDGQFNELVSTNTVYTLQYSRLETVDEIIISVIGGHTLELTYMFNDIVRLEIDIEDFSHWEEDGVIVSYNPNYAFSALKHRTLEAKTNGLAEPLITLVVFDDLRDEHTSYLGYLELPAGYEVIEKGFLVSDTESILTLDNAQVIRSNASNPLTNEYLMSIPNAVASTFTQQRAYAVIKSAEGIEVIYSYVELPDFEITWLDDDGAFLASDVYGYGEIPSYHGESPTKASTDNYDYVFIGWDSEIVAVTENKIYQAVYQEVLKYTNIEINYVDDITSNPLQEDFTTTVDAYGMFEFESPEIPGYTPKLLKVMGYGLEASYTFTVRYASNASFSVLSARTSESADYDWEGSGTEEDPYLIQTAEELWGLSYAANASLTYNGIGASAQTFEGVYFRLTTNIDLNGVDWEPIGHATTASTSNNFKGFFDGNNHIIIGLASADNAPGANNGNNRWKGLFGVVENGMVSNLTVRGQMSGGIYVGGIISHMINATASNLVAEIHINAGKQYVGGVIGFATDSTLVNVVNYGEVNPYNHSSTTANIKMGGVVGQSTGGHLEDVVNYGHIKGAVSNIEVSYVGGITGHSDNASSSIKNAYNYGNVEGVGRVAGIAGHANGDNENLYNFGQVEGKSSLIGGIVGYANAAITDAYNYGDVISTAVPHSDGQTVVTTQYIGGVVGQHNGGLLENAYNYGHVVAKNEALLQSFYVGGITGQAAAGTSIIIAINHGDVTGYSGVGGVFGYATGTITFENIESYGTATGTEDVNHLIGRQ